MDILAITTHFFLALVVGGLIGLERSHNGHAAGFRTYSLVCLASTMLLEVAGAPIFHGILAHSSTFSDQTSRIVQGLLAGVGFIGAGVIVKEGHTVRGLTTAASIWVTATLGILIGSGFYAAATIGALMTMATLTIFRNVENKVPRRRYVHCYIKFLREHTMPEPELKAFVKEQGYQVEDISYDLNGGGTTFEYHLNMWSKDPTAHGRLVHALAVMPEIKELRVIPSRD